MDNRIAAFFKGQEHQDTDEIVNSVHKAWQEFWGERVPPEMKEAMTGDNVEILRRTFAAGFAYGRRA